MAGGGRMEYYDGRLKITELLSMGNYRVHHPRDSGLNVSGDNRKSWGYYRACCILKPKVKLYLRIPEHPYTGMHQIEPNNLETTTPQSRLKIGDKIEFQTIKGRPYEYNKEVGIVIGLNPTVLAIDIGELEPYDQPKANDTRYTNSKTRYGITGTLPHVRGARIYLREAYTDMGVMMKNSILPIMIREEKGINYTEHLFLPSIMDYS